MSHEISYSDGRHEMFVAGEKPWHGLGEVVDQAPNSAEAIKLAHLDWDVDKEPLFMQNDEGTNHTIIDGYNAVVRKDTNKCLGIVSDRYQLIQNIEAFNFLDGLYQDGILKYESAGALKHGKIVWLLARVPETFKIVDGDEVEPYMLFTNYHDGSGAAQCMPTAVRVVCNNTLRLALSDVSKAVRIVHKGDVSYKMRIAQDILGVSKSVFGLHVDSARKMAQKRIEMVDFYEYLDELFPEVEDKGKARTIRTAIRDSIRDNYIQGKEQEYCRNTVWAAYNAVSHYSDHDARGRRTNDISDQEVRFSRTILGSGHQLKSRAWSLAESMV